MNDARVYILLGKKLSNEASNDELAELGQLLQHNSVQPHLVEQLREVWQKKERVNELELDEKWERVARRFTTEPEISKAIPLSHQKKTIPLFLRLAIVIAAVLTGIILLSVWLLQPAKEQRHSLATAIETKDSITVALNGERKIIMLPDSTEVHLNSGSSLVYNKVFGNENREVWLNGEAFFNVTKDAAHPFLVNTNLMMVKVLGTVFNVKAYNTREDIETTVVEGKVEVSFKENAEKKVILLPNEKISLKNNQMFKADAHAPAAIAPLNYEVQTVKADNKETGMPEETVWVKEKVVFTEEPFEIVALKMERWYNVRIHFEKENMKTIRMSGDFDNVSINEAMGVLQMMVRFNYEMNGNDIYIK